MTETIFNQISKLAEKRGKMWRMLEEDLKYCDDNHLWRARTHMKAAKIEMAIHRLEMKANRDAK